MRYLTNTLFLFLFIFLSVAVPASAQQSSIDMNRMNRDINIMENVLTEIFKVQLQSQGNPSFYSLYGSWASGTNTVRGTYLPGYGVIFTVSSLNRPLAIAFEANAPDSSHAYRFTYSNGSSSGAEVTEESVVTRIEEFLRDYGSTIGQLDEDDSVMVIFGTGLNSGGIPFPVTYVNHNGTSPIPGVSVVATKSDLDANRSGRLSNSAFRERLAVASIAEPESQPLDIRVMANIFETGLGGGGNAGFRIRGSVNHLSLDNFGTLFFFDVSYQATSASFFHIAPGELSVLVNNLRREATEPEENVELDAEMDVEVERQLEVAREAMVREMREQEVRREERNEAIQNAYDSLKTQVKEFIVDYGRTLNSVSSDQYILVSVSATHSDETVPERTDFQIQKSVLEALGRGAMTRERAIEEITVTEY